MTATTTTTSVRCLSPCSKHAKMIIIQGSNIKKRVLKPPHDVWTDNFTTVFICFHDFGAVMWGTLDSFLKWSLAIWSGQNLCWLSVLNSSSLSANPQGCDYRSTWSLLQAKSENKHMQKGKQTINKQITALRNLYGGFLLRNSHNKQIIYIDLNRHSRNPPSIPQPAQTIPKVPSKSTGESNPKLRIHKKS